VSAGSLVHIALASTLNKDDTPDTDEYRPLNYSSHADDYSYVMHGKLFKINPSGADNSRMEIFVSFGGLLLAMRGLAEYFTGFAVDQRIYLLMRKDGENPKATTDDVEDDP
jgi:DNA-directed RNA polymerase I, II, and III subunit RPABC3